MNKTKAQKIRTVTFVEYQTDYYTLLEIYYGKQWKEYVPNSKHLLQYYIAMLNPLQAFVEVLKIRTAG